MPPPLDLLTPNEVHAYVDQLCADLDAAGLSDAARRLQDVQGQVFTTGSEWRGELRQAARAIRRQARLPPDLHRRVSRLLESEYFERVALWQIWQAVFHGSALLAGVAALVSVVTLSTVKGGPWAMLPVVILVVLAAVAGYAVRRMSVCPGCGERSQHPEQAWCPFCGMRRSSGSPGPRRRIRPQRRASALTRCPSCGHPPSGRSRYGRPLPSEGWFCGHCGGALPNDGPG